MECDVVVPVGPGHEQVYNEAVESVRIASLDKGMFTRVNLQIIDDTEGKYGRSQARNMAVRNSKADWVFFLDADDLMHPKAFKAVSRYPYVDAVWGNIYETSNGVAVWRYQVPEMSTYQELLAFRPYLTLQMGHFVKRTVAEKHPFDETMNCGEDVKYYLEMWKTQDCLKVEDCFFLNRKGVHSIGPRSATGREWDAVTAKLMNEARIAENPFIEKDGYVFPSTDTHFTKATFELDQIPYCVEQCEKRRLAMDIGAHVGAWTKELAKHFKFVRSFEAKEINFDCLEKNIQGIENVFASQYAIGDDNKTVSVHEAIDPGNSGAGWIQEGDEVEMIALDKVDRYRDVDFIKIDVEGFEPFVIEGARETIEKNRPVILIEQTPGIDMRFGLPYTRAGEMLEEMGYTLKKQMNKNYLYVP